MRTSRSAGGDDLLAGCAMADETGDPIAPLQRGHAGTDLAHNAGKLARRRKRKWRADLVASFDQQRIEEIERGSRHRHDHFAGPCLGRGKIGHREHVRSAELRAQHGAHLPVPTVFVRLLQASSGPQRSAMPSHRGLHPLSI